MTEKYTKGALWKTKDEELQALADEMEIPYDPADFDRRAVIDSILARDTEKPLFEDGADGTGQGRAYVDVVFHNQEGEPKLVYVGHHGRSFWLPREVVCRVPAEIMDTIKNAVREQLVQTTTGDGRVAHKMVKIPRFSYEVVGRGRL